MNTNSGASGALIGSSYARACMKLTFCCATSATFAGQGPKPPGGAA